MSLSLLSFCLSDFVSLGCPKLQKGVYYRIYACIGRTFFAKNSRGKLGCSLYSKSHFMKKKYIFIISNTPEIIFQENYFFYNLSENCAAAYTRARPIPA
jgi:hypothetical protein